MSKETVKLIHDAYESTKNDTLPKEEVKAAFFKKIEAILSPQTDLASPTITC